MYYLLKTYEMRSLGGSGAITRTKLIKKSELKENLIFYLRDLFMESMDDNQVEFINGYEKDSDCEYELSDIEDNLFGDNTESFKQFIHDGLMVQYYSDGFDVESITYVILNDEETEFI